MGLRAGPPQLSCDCRGRVRPARAAAAAVDRRSPAGRVPGLPATDPVAGQPLPRRGLHGRGAGVGAGHPPDGGHRRRPRGAGVPAGRRLPALGGRHLRPRRPDRRPPRPLAHRGRGVRHQLLPLPAQQPGQAGDRDADAPRPAVRARRRRRRRAGLRPPGIGDDRHPAPARRLAPPVGPRPVRGRDPRHVPVRRRLPPPVGRGRGPQPVPPGRHPPGEGFTFPAPGPARSPTTPPSNPCSPGSGSRPSDASR